VKRKNDQPLTKLADAAFEQAARKVIERAKATNTPVIVWKNAAVTEVEPVPSGEPSDLQQSKGVRTL
jgi:hypothetical protein